MDMWCALLGTLLPSLGRRRLCLLSDPPFIDLSRESGQLTSHWDPRLAAHVPLGITVQPTDLRLFPEGSRKAAVAASIYRSPRCARRGAGENDRTAQLQLTMWTVGLLWLCMAGWFNVVSFHPYINPWEGGLVYLFLQMTKLRQRSFKSKNKKDPKQWNGDLNLGFASM